VIFVRLSSGGGMSIEPEKGELKKKHPNPDSYM